MHLRHVGSADASLGFDPDNPFDMRLMLNERAYSFEARDILHVDTDAADWVLEVALPADLRKAAGRSLEFRSSGARNWFDHLAATGEVPDRATLSILTRTCTR